MKPFNIERREKQIEFLDAQEAKESLGRESAYLIKAENGKTESCQSAGTAQMVLATQFAKVNVWVTKLH